MNIDFFSEGLAARERADIAGLRGSQRQLEYARDEYRLLLKAISQKRSVSTYRPFIRGFYQLPRN